MLEMPSDWRFGDPGELNSTALSEFQDLVLKVSGQGNSWAILELFKAKFNGSASQSSSESWAQSDLWEFMQGAANNAPTFIAAVWAGCEEVKMAFPQNSVPDENILNQILADNNVNYEIRLPKLVTRSQINAPSIVIPEMTNDERTRNLIQKSLADSDRFLSDQKPRQAVQEILWLLETVSTGLEGHETQSGTIEGKYFNKIVINLKRQKQSTTLKEVMGWISKLHGYLSAPTGGGVRHGVHLTKGVEMNIHEAHLYCNLTRSYIGYLLDELDKPTG